jgi:urease accessory protein
MNARQPPATELSASTWPAQLRLRIEQREGVGTRLVACTHRGPLRIQRPFYPEGIDCAHLYILHPPGGLVSGDDLAIDVSVGQNANVLLTTPGAGRIYRARTVQPARQTQRVQLQIEANAVLEWLPQPTIVFDGANVLLDLNVSLAADAGFIGWETLCLGRPASQLAFERGHIEQRWRIHRENHGDIAPLLNDRLCIDGDDRLRDARWGLQKFPVYGTFLAVPAAQRPLPKNALECVRELIAQQQAATEMAVTVVRGCLILRYLGASTERSQALFEASWTLIRPWLNGRASVRPRIWNT